MSALFTADEILHATRGSWASGRTDGQQARIVWQLDQVQPGDWFFAIPSQLADPHDDLAAAFSRGAKGFVVNRRRRYLGLPENAPLIVVPDTKLALLDLAGYWRHRVRPKVVGVTGSHGRRACMVLLSQLVDEHFKTHVAFASDLNWSGCIREVLEMPIDTELLIFEAGALERGDIARIGGALEPNLAVVTSARHPLASPSRDAAGAAMYCELLQTLPNRTIAEVAAVIHDEDATLHERAKAVLNGLPARMRSASQPSLADRVPDASLQMLADAMEESMDLSVSRAELWCALETALALGVPAEALEDAMEIAPSQVVAIAS